MNAPREIKGSSQWTRSDKVNTRRIVSEGIKSTFENSFGPQNTGDNRGSDSASNWRLNSALPSRPPFGHLAVSFVRVTGRLSAEAAGGMMDDAAASCSYMMEGDFQLR